uniref:Uncharacterized protein n=1 Tax=Glossina palpalis gambiensis TaxID=67801 RepID=A0A1B0BIA1_9MUSC
MRGFSDDDVVLVGAKCPESVCDSVLFVSTFSVVVTVVKASVATEVVVVGSTVVVDEVENKCFTFFNFLMYLYGCRVYLLVSTVVLVGAVVEVVVDDSRSPRLRLAGDFSIIFLNLFRVVLKTAFAVVVAVVVVSHDAYTSVVIFALEGELVDDFGVGVEVVVGGLYVFLKFNSSLAGIAVCNEEEEQCSSVRTDDIAVAVSSAPHLHHPPFGGRMHCSIEGKAICYDGGYV